MSETHTQPLIDSIRDWLGSGPLPLHRSTFSVVEREAVIACLESGIVSSVGPDVEAFEVAVADFAKARFGVATVNGTHALQLALRVVGVEASCEVLTQALTFVATANAIAYLGAQPVFIDVERPTMGLCPDALQAFLYRHGDLRDDGCYNRLTGARIAACVPMHTLGHPCRIADLSDICRRWRIPLVEDAAEGLGSWRGDRHVGTFGQVGVLSFNGNKIITTGGGGLLISDDPVLASRARHLSTTAKKPGSPDYFHDELGYNFRMPNLNASLGRAQMDRIEPMLRSRRELARRYRDRCRDLGLAFIDEPEGAYSNFWLNGIVLETRAEREAFVESSNKQGVMTRPIWRLMVDLPMYADCWNDGLTVSRWLEARVATLPSWLP